MRFVYYSLFFAVPLLVNSATSELFEFNKMMLIYLAAIAITSLWLFKTINEKKIILRKTIFDLPIGIFFLSQVISTIFSIDKQTSLFGYYGRFNGGLFSLVAYLILFYGAVTFLNIDNIKKVLRISILSSFVVILWGIPGKLGFDFSCLVFTGRFNNSCWTEQFRPHERMFSTLGQPNWLGAYLVINFFIALYFFVQAFLKHQKGRWNNPRIWIAYLFINISAILFTRSRSSLVASGIGFLIFLVGFILKKQVKAKKQVALKRIVLPLLGIFVVSVLLFKSGISTIDRFLAIPSKDSLNKTTQESSTKSTGSEITESLDIRKIVWKGAWDLGLRYPLFGSGVETFAYSYYLVRPLAHNLTSEWDYLYNKAHNEYLNYFATTGFFGLISYLFFVITLGIWAVRRVIDEKEKESLLMLCIFIGWVSILITNFFGFSTTTINLFFYMTPGILLISSTNKTNKPIFFERKIFFQKRSLYIGTSVLVIFLTGWLISYYIADTKYALGNAYAQSGDYQKASQLLNGALQLHYEHVYEDKLSYSLANLAFLAAYQKEQKVATDLIKRADFYNIRSIQASPQNPLYWKTRGKNYYLFYQITLNKEYLVKAVDALNQDQKLSPTDPKVPYTLSIFYSLLADEEQSADVKLRYQERAIFYVTQSTQLKADFRDGYFLQGQLYKKYGDSEKAKQIFNDMLALDPNDKEVQKELRQEKRVD